MRYRIDGMEMDELSGCPVPKPADEIIEKMHLVLEDKSDDGKSLLMHYDLDGDRYIHRVIDGAWLFIPKN
jgi:hypothetical protein